MYCYELESPIDFFHGFLTVKEMWRHIGGANIEQPLAGGDHDFKASLQKAEETLGKINDQNWRSEIMVSMLPGADGNSHYVFVRKLDNNGTTYVASEIQLQHLDNYLKN